MLSKHVKRHLKTSTLKLVIGYIVIILSVILLGPQSPLTEGASNTEAKETNKVSKEASLVTGSGEYRRWYQYRLRI